MTQARDRVVDEKAVAFGEWFVAQADTLGMRSVEIARHMGVKRNQVYRWRQGLARPNPDTCLRIAQAMGLEPNDVLAAAGWVNEIDDSRQKLIALIRYLPDDMLDDAHRYIKFLVGQ